MFGQKETARLLGEMFSCYSSAVFWLMDLIYSFLNNLKKFSDVEARMLFRVNPTPQIKS